MSVVDYMVQQSFVGVGKETVYGTPVVPGFWFPIQSPKWTPKLKWLPDNSMVGSPTETRDLVPGVRFDEFTCKHHLYLDSIGNELLGILGADDVVTGTGPYVHTFKLLNNPSGSQMPSYTIDYFDASQTRELSASRMATLELAWSADGDVEVTPTWICNPESNIDLPTQTLSTATFVPGWNLSVTINGVQSNIMVSGSLTISRGTASIWVSNGQQAPHINFAGPISAKGKAKFMVETSVTDFFAVDEGMGRAQQPLTGEWRHPGVHDDERPVYEPGP